MYAIPKITKKIVHAVAMLFSKNINSRPSVCDFRVDIPGVSTDSVMEKIVSISWIEV